MNPSDPPIVWRRELAKLLQVLDSDTRGVVLLGRAGVGKTSLLRMAEQELYDGGRTVLLVSSTGLTDPDDLGRLILRSLDRYLRSRISSDVYTIGDQRSIRSSAGGRLFLEAAEVLRSHGSRRQPAVLLVDALDESPYPGRIAAAVEELSLRLNNWKIVVASRVGAPDIGRFTGFRFIELSGLSLEEADRLIEAYGPALSPDVRRRAVALGQGNPLFLRVLANELRSGLLDTTEIVSLSSMLERIVTRAINISLHPAKLSNLFEQLALAGGRDRVTSLAAKMNISEDETRNLLNTALTAVLLVFEDADQTVTLFHIVLRDVILARRIFAHKEVRIAELSFGSEEAERDELLEQTYVRRPSLGVILKQQRSIVIGDRGSGKSAIFRQLASRMFDLNDRPPIEVRPVANSADLLNRIVDKHAGLNAETLRAAWMVVVASVVASAIPPSAPKQVRRAASALRAAFAPPGKKEVLWRRLLRGAVRPFAGTKLKLAVGPINLEVQLPSGIGTTSKATVDVSSFLEEADNILSRLPLRVIVMFDRIDETFKYDRTKQEALIQALLQAESRISLLRSIGLVVFLRTDLFELYDIQEKTKLVSRTLTLDWSEEEWLQLLVNRVFANPTLQTLAETVHATAAPFELRAALEALFPRQIEDQPIERWLIDSVRNGNGDVSPRLAVLLLHLTRDASPRAGDLVSTLPLFSAEAVTSAMTRLSELSYSEVVTDFKVATAFVQNCRVRKRDSFALSDVEALFDESEGTISEQVRLLERLGFLERVVVEGDSGAKQFFRVPKLYTRCWS
jgi:hypothetical protein